MAKIDLDDVASGYNRQRINNNFQSLEDELNNKVLYRDNPTGEPNQMENDLDMNSNDVYNAKTVSADELFVDGQKVTTAELLPTAVPLVYDSIADLPPVVVGLSVITNSYHSGLGVGGIEQGVGVASARHDGVINFDPSRASEIGTAAYYVDSGSDVACWVRVGVGDLFLVDAGVRFDDDTDNTAAIQKCINLAAKLGINRVLCNSGVARYTRLFFSYDPVNNPDYPQTVRHGWGLIFEGKGRLYTEPTAQIENEISATLGTVLRSTEAANVAINAVVDNPATTQAGLQFKDIAFVADSTSCVVQTSAIANTRLFDNVSVHQKNDDGSGVLCEDHWVCNWGDVLISGPDYTGVQTGDGLVVRNRLFAGGGMWNFTVINIRGFKNSGALGYMLDPGFEVKLLDSIVIGVIQSRNAANGLKIGGKVRSIVINGYHTEACTVTGGQIAAEAGSVLLLSSYFDCALCSVASLVLGNGAGVAGANLDERTWSEVELRTFNFIDVNQVGLKIADGAIGENLVLGTGKFGSIHGAGLLGIDFDNFEGNVRLSNVRYSNLTADVANRPNAVEYVDDGNFTAYKTSLIEYQKESVNVETLAVTKFLNSESQQNQVITPTVSFGRVVLPPASSKRKFLFKNDDVSVGLNIRDNTNTTTLYSVAAGEHVTSISDGTNWYFI